jgi:hypothetical protein
MIEKKMTKIISPAKIFAKGIIEGWKLIFSILKKRSPIKKNMTRLII